jgi:hypothetical protein
MSRVVTANVEVAAAIDPPVVTNGRRLFTGSARLVRTTKRPNSWMAATR